MLIVDAHHDLAWNMLTFGRNYLRSTIETRRLEQGTEIPALNDDTMLGWPEYQRGKVALVFATLFASPQRHCAGSWDKLCYIDADQANRMYQEQLDVYDRLFDDHPDQFRPVRNHADLKDLLCIWESPPVIDSENGSVRKGNPVGLAILMEGADGVRDPGELDEWWERGVRFIGPAWMGTHYTGGWNEPGPLTGPGRSLLEKMGELGFGLDLSHMDEKAVFQALDIYDGPILASHSNAQALLEGDDSNRHLSDRAIQGILERSGVIGINFYNTYLKPGWKRGDRRQEVPIDLLISQIDYICQTAGDAAHVGLGSDFDGGLGLQSVPYGIDSVADLPKLVPGLHQRGYSDDDCGAIMGGNWLSILRRILPGGSSA
jgi:membrane dipeptidase